MTANTVYREIHPRLTAPVDTVDDWRAFAHEGNRVGAAKALVTLVVFSDYQCPACRRLNKKLTALQFTHRTTLAIVWRHFPLEGHPLARTAALASECAAAQGRFEEMHQQLFENQTSLTTRIWGSLAQRAGVLDTTRFNACLLHDATTLGKLAVDMEAARMLGVDATPTLLLGNNVFLGVGDIDRRLKQHLASAEHSQ